MPRISEISNNNKMLSKHDEIEVTQRLRDAGIPYPPDEADPSAWFHSEVVPALHACGIAVVGPPSFDVADPGYEFWVFLAARTTAESAPMTIQFMPHARQLLPGDDRRRGGVRSKHGGHLGGRT